MTLQSALRRFQALSDLRARHVSDLAQRLETEREGLGRAELGVETLDGAILAVDHELAGLGEGLATGEVSAPTVEATRAREAALFIRRSMLTDRRLAAELRSQGAAEAVRVVEAALRRARARHEAASRVADREAESIVRKSIRRGDKAIDEANAHRLAIGQPWN